jgi:hypothetical protein
MLARILEQHARSVTRAESGISRHLGALTRWARDAGHAAAAYITLSIRRQGPCAYTADQMSGTSPRARPDAGMELG